VFFFVVVIKWQKFITIKALAQHLCGIEIIIGSGPQGKD
jgi:hypothetical protein